MALYPDPLDSILASIKSLNSGTELGRDEYIFDAPVAIPPEAGGINTSLRISQNGPTSPYAGEVTVKHIRLNLDDLRILVPSDIRVSGVTTTLEFATQLNRIYGTNIGASDIETTGMALTDGVGTITLTAKPASRAWIGTVTFNVTPGRFQLADYLTDTTLDGLQYPDPYEGKAFGNAYAYWRNFSDQFTALETITVESPDWTAIKDVLVAVTTDAWVLTGSSRFSLEGAEVLYVGAVAGYPELNQTYDKAVVLKLGAACLGYSGRMFLHYNEPDE
jgi:hypothetical protein